MFWCTQPIGLQIYLGNVSKNSTNEDEWNDLKLFGYRSGKRSWKIDDQKIDLINQNDGKRGIDSRNGIDQKTAFKGYIKPMKLFGVDQKQVDEKTDHRQPQGGELYFFLVRFWKNP